MWGVGCVGGLWGIVRLALGELVCILMGVMGFVWGCVRRGIRPLILPVGRVCRHVYNVRILLPIVRHAYHNFTLIMASASKPTNAPSITT